MHAIRIAACALVAQGALHGIATPAGAQGATPSATPGATPAAASRPDTIPLRPLAGRLRAVRVAVAGDTLDFLFDTGGSVTVISPQLAGRLGCTPGGRGVGYRMTGERLSGPHCPDVTLRVGALTSRVDAGVHDMAAMLGPRVPAVHGMISLQTFAGRAVTLDLAANRLIVETPRTLAARARAMTPLPMRVATGLHGGEVTPFVGIPAGRDAASHGGRLWLMLDTGHQAPTFLAPHAARALGVPDGADAAEVALPLAPGLPVVAPVRVKDVIHDGVLSAALAERAVFTLDLAGERMWVGPVAPLLGAAVGETPNAPAGAAPPSAEPAGRYEVVATVAGKPRPGVLVIERRGGVLTGAYRDANEEGVVPVRDITVEGGSLAYVLGFPTPVPVRITFDGLTGSGTWGEGERSGAISAVKRS